MRLAWPLVLAALLSAVLLSFYLFPRPELLGQALEQGGRLDEALGYYQQALALNPADDVTWLRVAGIHQLRGLPEPAIEIYQRLVTLDPYDVGYRRTLALLLEWSLRIDEAAVQKEQLAALDPQDIVVRRELISYYLLERKDYGAAIERAEEIVAARPHDVEALLDLAQLYGLAGRLRDAAAVAERARAVDPSNPLVHRALAQANRWEREVREAIARYREQLTRNPSDTVVLSNLAALLRRTGAVAEAEALEQQLAAR